MTCLSVMQAANTEENSMGFRVPIGMSSQQSNVSMFFFLNNF
jgi:hypothetical protein